MYEITSEQYTNGEREHESRKITQTVPVSLESWIDVEVGESDDDYILERLEEERCEIASVIETAKKIIKRDLGRFRDDLTTKEQIEMIDIASALGAMDFNFDVLELE